MQNRCSTFEMKNIALILLLLVTNNLTAQSEKLFRFYDFGVEIDFHHLLFDNDYKIIFSNGFKYDDLNKNSLYKIQYSYDKNKKRIPTDTLKVELNEKEMNDLFTLTKKQFDIEYDKNLSKYKIPPPPPAYDGMIVKLTFDLKFRGDEYIKQFGLPFFDQRFNELNDFIEKLMKKLRTE